jgi:hypothetical protein
MLCCNTLYLALVPRKCITDITCQRNYLQKQFCYFRHLCWVRWNLFHPRISSKLSQSRRFVYFSPMWLHFPPGYFHFHCLWPQFFPVRCQCLNHYHYSHKARQIAHQKQVRYFLFSERSLALQGLSCLVHIPLLTYYQLVELEGTKAFIFLWRGIP